MVEQDGSTCLFLTQNILEHYSQWSAAILSVRNTSTVLIHTAVSTSHKAGGYDTCTNYIMTITTQLYGCTVR